MFPATLSIYFLACNYLCRVETLLSFLYSLLELVHGQLMLRQSCKQDFMVVTSDIIWRYGLTKYSLALRCGSWWVSIAEDTVHFRGRAQKPWSQVESPVLSCLMIQHELFFLKLCLKGSDFIPRRKESYIGQKTNLQTLCSSTISFCLYLSLSFSLQLG